MDDITRLTDFDADNPPGKGTLFKATNYEDERAPIIRFEGQRQVEVVAVEPSDPHAGSMAADPDFQPPTKTVHKLQFSTHRPGGFWKEGETSEIGDGMYEGRGDLVVVDADGQPITREGDK